MEQDSGTNASADSAARTVEPLSFTGTGAEYFRIWIVNLLLTLVTVGIYSPWAKVRRLQYFHRHTQLAGSSFDFHGRAVAILVGRLVALGLFVVYQVAVRQRSAWTLAVLGGVAIAMPWLLRNSLRFRLYNTSWRGTRFHFRGGLGGAYRVFLLNGLLTLVTLYVLAPFTHQRLKAYQHDNTWFGRTPFSFHARVGQFYRLYLLLLGALLLVGVVIGFLGAGGAFASLYQSKLHGGAPNPAALWRALAVIYAVIVLAGVSLGPVFRALLANLIWSNTRLAEHRIECRIPPLGLAWIGLGNFVLIVLTLGFYTPWAAVRTARYQLACVRLVPAGDLDSFLDSEAEEVGAVGEESAAVFDFDIAL